MQIYIKFLKTQRKVYLKIRFRRVLFFTIHIIILSINIIQKIKHTASHGSDLQGNTIWLLLFSYNFHRLIYNLLDHKPFVLY